MSSFADQIANLPPEKLELLARRLGMKSAEATRARHITRRPEPEPFPALSFAQQRLWFLDQLNPGSPVYNVATAIRMKGRLDVEALGRSLNEVVRRHESLRTTFATVEGQPVQVIAPGLSVDVPLIDLRHLGEAEREAEAKRLACGEERSPFDLAEGPLVRARLYWLRDDEHLALLTLHHIISDGWSLQVLVGELGTLYEAFAAGRPSPLAELPVQYA